MPYVVDPWVSVSILAEDTRDAIIGETRDGVIVNWNDGAAELLGYGADEMIGRSATCLSASASFAVDSSCLVRRLEAGERVRWFKAEMVRKDGRAVAATIAVLPVFGGSGQLIGLAKIVRALGGPTAEAAEGSDEAGRRQLEREVAHLARWSTMGQMANLLAHELNQPLTAIVSYLTAARRLLRAPKPDDLGVLASAMDRANDQASRAAKIIGHLRSFVSPSDVERQLFRIGATIMETSDLALIAAKQAGIVVNFQLTEDATVLADRVQIEQVIFNLMRNAVEAMAKAPRRELRVSTARRDGHIIVSVSDTGPGIPAEVSDRLFQPFVTTKPDDMGVGLSICRMIVNAHGGELWFDDALPPGATFHFKLPLVTETTW